VYTHVSKCENDKRRKGKKYSRAEVQHLTNTYKAVSLILCTAGKKDWSGEDGGGRGGKNKGRKEEMERGRERGR
jgi:hypothetical protein